MDRSYSDKGFLSEVRLPRFLYIVLFLNNLQLFKRVLALESHEAVDKLNIKDDVANECDEKHELDLVGSDSYLILDM